MTNNKGSFYNCWVVENNGIWKSLKHRKWIIRPNTPAAGLKTNIKGELKGRETPGSPEFLQYLDFWVLSEVNATLCKQSPWMEGHNKGGGVELGFL